MNITLALIRLCHKQVCDMSANAILIANSITAKDLLESNKPSELVISTALRVLHSSIH